VAGHRPSAVEVEGGNPGVKVLAARQAWAAVVAGEAVVAVAAGEPRRRNGKLVLWRTTRSQYLGGFVWRSKSAESRLLSRACFWA